MPDTTSTHIKTDYPHPVRVIEHTTITMSDGVELAAKIWLPEDAASRPVPAILEYIPYRKRDWTSIRDTQMHAYVAGHGYACVRVDLRGSGESEGVLRDEYLALELQDGVEIIRWLTERDWCDGKVGMVGISWGGFNGLQIAALRPPGLAAIVTCCSTDDRYADDVHYMGGCLLGDNLSWASIMFGRNGDPPDPRLVGDSWRQQWRRRLENSGLWLETWLRHQHRDAYWRHGSVCEDYAAIEVPVFAVSGWADGYSNAVFRLLAGLDVPRLGLVGPWSHKYPHVGVPGPAIGFLQEMLRWWDHWLKGRETQIMDEPMVRVWMQDSAAPSVGYAMRPGRWVGEPSWPSAQIEARSYALQSSGDLAREGEPDDEVFTVQSPLSVGLFAGKWCSYSAPPDLPDDQREEDGGALVFDTPTLERAVEIFGAPAVELELAVSEPVAMVAVRLSDVRPDGAVTRVSYGLLNLTHRDSHANPTALEPGKRYRVRVELNHIAQRFPAGHRIRLALSTSYWPLAWPAPRPFALELHTRASRLLLPEREARPEDQHISYAPVEMAAPPAVTVLAPDEGSWRVIRDLGRNESTLVVSQDRGRLRFDDHDWEVHSSGEERYRVHHHDWSSLRGETTWQRSFERDGWRVRTRTRTRLTCDAERFYLDAELDAYEGERRVFSKTWCEQIERELV